MQENTSLNLQVVAIRLEADGIRSFELTDPAGCELPAFQAGAHIELALPGGLARSYSLVNAETVRDRYLIAVSKDSASRGGSRFLHEEVRVGDLLAVSTPRNNFALSDDGPAAVLIAGGIGITPMLPMLHRLNARRARWTLHYCARTRRHAALVEQLEQLSQASEGRGSVQYHFDQAPGGRRLDLHDTLRIVPADVHLYCCGPEPMLKAFEEAARPRPERFVHLERFAASEAPATEGGFEVELARSGRCLAVPPGRTILDVLLEAGVDAPYSCREGVCSTCETRVLAGQPEHRDVVLSKTDKASNKVMMICCSGSRSDKLVLDI